MDIHQPSTAQNAMFRKKIITVPVVGFETELALLLYFKCLAKHHIFQ